MTLYIERLESIVQELVKVKKISDTVHTSEAAEISHALQMQINELNDVIACMEEA